MKLSTRQYAKKQVRWIRNRLIPAINAANELGLEAAGFPCRIFPLDATGASGHTHDMFPSNLLAELGEKWDTNVKDTAIAIMQGMAVRHAAQVPPNADKCVDFIAGDYGSLPDPLELSGPAPGLLNVKRSTLTYAAYNPSVMQCSHMSIEFCAAFSPSEGLTARRKRVCDVCTKDPDRPVMLEAGNEWDVHVKTRKHCKLAHAEKHEETIQVKREEARLRREAKNKALTE